ncbi:MAG: hypothetical protein K8R13_00140 [Methanococcoides sp.]|nr:hypothetical protein [Methanococcoides sp.]
MTLVPINCSFLQTAKLMPSNVKFDYQDVVTVMLHAATSSTNSLESASNDLIFKNSTQKIPSADTIFEYIKYMRAVCALFLKINLDKRKKGGCVHSELHLIGTTVCLPVPKYWTSILPYCM